MTTSQAFTNEIIRMTTRMYLSGSKLDTEEARAWDNEFFDGKVRSVLRPDWMEESEKEDEEKLLLTCDNCYQSQIRKMEDVEPKPLQTRCENCKVQSAIEINRKEHSFKQGRILTQGATK